MNADLISLEVVQVHDLSKFTTYLSSRAIQVHEL